MTSWPDPLLAYDRPEYMRSMFPRQRAFVDDKARFKAALCGRRAGKTEGVARWLLDGAARFPRTTQIYIALSQRNARRILWSTLQAVVAQGGITVDFNEQMLECRLPNRSLIWVTGCPDRAQCEDFRGHPRVKRVAIDEAASFPGWLEYLVEDVLTPGLMDMLGDLALTGSPGLTPIGYFWDRTDGDRPWSTHRWTCLDNPHVHGASEIERLKRENKWDEDHPTLVREWYGRWTRDDSAIVYPFDPSKNIGELPQEDGRVIRVLSVDIGWDDPCAFVVGASRYGDPTWYCEKAWRKKGLITPRIAAEIDQALYDAKQAGKPIDRIVVDEGAIGKTVANDLRSSYGIACEAANKRDKKAAIHNFRGSMIAGTVKIAPMACQQLREEWTTCAWNEDRDDHDERCLDDLCDSALYNFREHNLNYAPEENPPKEGTKEFQLAYRAERLRALAKERNAKRRTA
jgi:hypothetical protein